MSDIRGPDAFACALFVIAAFSAAGTVHSAWLRAKASRRFVVPIDAGLRLRRRRLLGDNKTIRGFVVILPATALVFALFFRLAVYLDPQAALILWPLNTTGYAILGFWAALGFMLGELPNSFVKRQLDVRPGRAPGHRVGAAISFVVDHTDSIIGAMTAISLVAATPVLTWVYVLVLGPVVHLIFSALLYKLGVKARLA